MPSREALLAFVGAALTVAILVAAGGVAAAVFLFLGTGLLLAALFGEAGGAPAPEGGVGDAVSETVEFTERHPSVRTPSTALVAH